MAAEERPAWRISCDAMELLAVLHLFGFFSLFYARKPRFFTDNNLLGWGVIWEPFFFVMKGFKLTYSQLAKAEPQEVEPLVPFLLQRLVRVYPLYAISILLKAIQKVAYTNAHPSQVLQATPRWSQLLHSLLLWRTGWNEPAWMLRSLLVHWLLWHLVWPTLAILSARQTWGGLAVCALLTYLRILHSLLGFPPTLSSVPLAFATLPLFLAGSLLARLSSLSRASPTLVLAVGGKRRYGLGGLAACTLLLLTCSLCRSDHKRQPFRQGLLLPLQALLVHSLATEADLLAQLLRWRPLARASRCRYALALLQDSACTTLLKHWVMHWQRFQAPTFFAFAVPAFLAAGSLMAQAAEPATRCLKERLTRLLGPGHPPPAGAAAGGPPSPLDAFAAAEFAAVLHVFGFHLIFYSFKPQFYFEQNFIAWGGSWDPFFFVLSGFKLTYLQLLKGNPSNAGSLRSFMARRLMRVYPLYVFSLLLKCILKLIYDNPHPTQRPEYNVFGWASLLENLLLWKNHWNGPAWFIRNILVHSLLWHLLCPWLMALSVSACWCGLACAMITTYLRILVWRLGKPHLDLHLAHHSLANFHLFLCGAFLARLSAARGFRGLLPVVLGRRRCACGGMVALCLLLGALASSTSGKERVHVKVGMLLPLQAMLAHSLASKDDLLAQLCRHRPLPRLGGSTYALAILQDPTITVLMRYWVRHWRAFDLECFWFMILPSYVFLGVLSARFVEPVAALYLQHLGRFVSVHCGWRSSASHADGKAGTRNAEAQGEGEQKKYF